MASIRLSLLGMRTLICLILLPTLLLGQAFVHPENNEAFLQDEVAEIHITVSAADLSTLLGDSLFTDHHFPAVFRYQSANFSDTLQSVGFRVRGNTSRNAKKKGFKVSFNEYVVGQKFKGIEKMNLIGQHNDPSLLRYWTSLHLLQRYGLIASRTSFVKLYLNGNYRGLYLNVEHIDDEFLQKRFIDDDGGNLYKASWGADLNYWGSNPNSYRSVYELKTNKDSNDYSAFILFLDSLNNISDSDFPCYMERNFEVNHYLKTLATEILIGHWDGHAFNKNNFYLYRQPSNGKFVFIEYDLDNTFGIDWFGVDWTDRNLNNWHESNRPLVERLLDVPYYKDVFNAYLDTLLTDLDTSSLGTVLENKQDLIKGAVLSDTYYRKDYGFQYADFLAALDDNYGAHVKTGLLEYLDERITSGQGQIQWIGNLEPPCDELPVEPERNLVKIVDFLGRETNFRTDIPLIFIYDDGTVEKIFTFKT